MEHTTKMYDLTPLNGRKSFYGKAKCLENENGDRTLFSYNVPIAHEHDGQIVRLCGDDALTATTLRHVRAFCGMNKREFLKVKMG